MADSIPSPPVLVTGATGFLGSHVVQQLLDRGHTVRGTVRDPESARQGFLAKLPGAADRLELVAADLTEPASFGPAVAGCAYVHHVASPYVLTVDDPQRDLVDPAVEGTLAVLEACANEPSVKRVVLTSSMAAMTDEPDGRVLTEDDWNEKSTLKRNPYYLSKTLAERAAWKFVDDRSPDFDLVVINPGGIIGPEHGDRVNTTNELVVNFTNGQIPVIAAIQNGIVDVRDVATAHIAAMDTPAASGRYVCVAETRSWGEIADFLASDFPNLRRPRLRAEGPIGTFIVRLLANLQPAGVRSFMKTNLGGSFRFDNSKIRRDLGIDFRPVDASMRDTVDNLIERGKIEAGA